MTETLICPDNGEPRVGSKIEYGDGSTARVLSVRLDPDGLGWLVTDTGDRDAAIVAGTLTDAAIAAQFGCARSTVRKIRHQLRAAGIMAPVAPPAPHFTVTEDATILRRVAVGDGVALAAVMGRSPQSIRDRRYRLRLRIAAGKPLRRRNG